MAEFCRGLNNSSVNLSATSSGAVTYSWNTGANTPTITTSDPGIYTVTATDENSFCSTTETISVANNAGTPSLTASASSDLFCFGETATLNAVSSSTDAAYSWSGSSVPIGFNTANAQVNVAGVYTVSIIDNVTGCSSTQTVAVNIVSVQALFVGDETAGLAPLTVNFTNLSTGATAYSWDFGNETSTQTNPNNTFPIGTHTITLMAMNGVCTSTADLVITVKQPFGPIPELFSPNGDDHNDLFEIKGLDSYPNNRIQIFNRWGNEVYNAKPYKNDWDGVPNANGKTGTSKLPPGTYFYILELGDSDKTIYKGYVQLVY